MNNIDLDSIKEELYYLWWGKDKKIDEAIKNIDQWYIIQYCKSADINPYYAYLLWKLVGAKEEGKTDTWW